MKLTRTKLTKTDTGYATPDGRWVITKNPASGSANLIDGYSQSKTFWRVEDTTRVSIINRGSALPYVRSFDRLWEVRDLIAGVHREEAREELARVLR